MSGQPRPSQLPVLIPLPDELVGPRVTVRPYREEDAPALWEAVEESREHLAPWLPWVGSYRSPEDAVAFTRRARARWLLREDLPVGIFELASGRLLGASGLHRINWELRTSRSATGSGARPRGGASSARRCSS